MKLCWNVPKFVPKLRLLSNSSWTSAIKTSTVGDVLAFRTKLKRCNDSTWCVAIFIFFKEDSILRWMMVKRWPLSRSSSLLWNCSLLNNKEWQPNFVWSKYYLRKWTGNVKSNATWFLICSDTWSQTLISSETGSPTPESTSAAMSKLFSFMTFQISSGSWPLKR